MKAKLILRFGPMFSGKTTVLLEKLNKYHLIGYRCIYVNHKMDNRSGVRNINSTCSTHSELAGNIGDIDSIKTDKLFSKEMNNHIVSNYDVIGIDEAQFVSNLYAGVVNLLKQDKIVVVVGLDGDFNMDRFGSILDLVPISDSAKKLYALCHVCCQAQKKTRASFTKLIVEHSTNSNIFVGGKSHYQATCRYHHADKNARVLQAINVKDLTIERRRK